MIEFVAGNVFIRTMGDEGLRVGQVVKGHKHNFDHVTIFFNGLWRVVRWLDDGGLIDQLEREGPFHLLIKAGVTHEFTFLGPGIGRVWCIYSHRTPQGEVTEAYTGWNVAYG